MIRRPPRSTLDRSSAASDVYKRQGQHDPDALGALLDTAMDQQADVVYAKPTNEPPHGPLRNLASRGAKGVVERLTTGAQASDFNSYRLIVGEVARSIAAYAGPGIYLDVAISWVARRAVTSPVEMRREGDRPSGYSMRALVSHFWRPVSYTHLRAHETVLDLVCRLLLEKKINKANGRSNSHKSNQVYSST